MAVPLILLVLIAGTSIIEAVQKKAIVAQAAGAAARVAVVRPDLAGEEALNVLQTSDSHIKAADVKTTVTEANIFHLPFSNPTRVTVTLKYRPISGFGWRPVFHLKSDYVLDRWVNGVLFDVK